MRMSLVWMVVGWSILFCASTSLVEAGTPASRPAYLIPVQIPYNAPPEPESRKSNKPPLPRKSFLKKN